MSSAAVSVPRRALRDHYFDRIAHNLWEGDWETIVATRTAGDRERLFIEATILCRYGKSLSLRGTPEKVRDVLAQARADRATRTFDWPSIQPGRRDHLTRI